MWDRLALKRLARIPRDPSALERDLLRESAGAVRTQPLCGGQAVTIVVTDASFEADVCRAALPVLVDFWAAWCQPCEVLAGELRVLAPQLEGQLVIAMANVAECRSLPRRLGIMFLPTLVLFTAGKEVTRVLGVPNGSAWDQLLGSAGLSLPTGWGHEKRAARALEQAHLNGGA